jgi:hypothetical protein
MPEGRYSRVNVETDPELLNEKQLAATFRPGISVPWAVITAFITAVTSIVGTYLATHTTPTDCASKGDINGLDLRISKQGEDIRALRATVDINASEEHNHFAIINGTLLTLARQK